MGNLSIVWESYSLKCPRKEFANCTMLKCLILKNKLMNIFHLAALVIIISPLWVIVDVLKDILKEIKKGRS